mmetsp:Transcript_3876/g.11224  ORF Transcript_3876/g.11224 Transcript_3876/m.11224 type:complete len:437 (-) Transcript_3876:486-1796(-)|eukprot:CAMPEP_0206147222 /NCGR_PEP_ID=MMETSP1473-20131121/32799_1 /ASSEMBLY_ACC=CAM_ASM_001109 /TAXON_ID=1461547 /ORGANISM="Stichococcus sp, Strain RCC1054" /LENGTH=436 /DNA_ID=CAMNT_0053544075 /DNA_START=398 /DNA_END=1708 /DNA_ORIENTATION=+
MSAKKPKTRVVTQAEALQSHTARNAMLGKADASGSSVSEVMEDAVLFMVHYLQEVQGPKYVVGRNFAYIAATPEARRLFLSTAKHLILQLVRDGNVDLTVTNYHDLMKLMCADFQLRVIKSAFKAAWVVLRDRPRTTASPRLPFSKFWYCLELTWLYEPYFLSVRRYVFDSDSHKVKLSAQVKVAALEVEQYIQREGWPAIPHDIMKVAVNHASFMHGDAQACHFDGIVRLLCVNELLRQHVKVENNSTTLAARQAAIAAATALAENRRRRKGLQSAAPGQGAVNSGGSDMARVRSYGSIEGHSLDRTTSFGSVASESPGSSCYSDPRGQDKHHSPVHLPHAAAVHSKESRGSSNSSSDGAASLEGLRGKAAPRGVVPVVLANTHSPVQVSATSHEAQSDSFVDGIGTRLAEMGFATPPKRPAAVTSSEIQPADDD